jgi:hypothetical protein
MIAIAERSIQDLAYPPALATRVAATATHELKLACQLDVVADGLAAELRKARPRRTVAALALNTAASGYEHAPIDQLLEHRMIALTITSRTWAVIRLTSCLDAEITLSGNVRGIVGPPETSAHATGHDPDHRRCGSTPGSHSRIRPPR